MFTENQVRQFYVTNSNAVAPSGSNPTSASSAGAMKFVVQGDEAYFLYKGPSDDGLQRTDIIKKCNIIDIRCTAAADLKHKKKKVEVAVKSALLSSTNLAVGGDFILNVDIHNFMTGDYNTTKVKFGAAKAASGTAVSDLYKKLALSLAKSFGREPVKYVKITLKGDGSHNEVLPNSDMTTSPFSGVTATAIEIEEVEQPWRKGAAPQEFVNFVAAPSTIYASGEDVVWGTVTDITASNTAAIVNSKKVADMEWFFHKERGDRYGEECWPINIDTTYQVDPNDAYGYSFVDIHYYFEGNSHNVGHSEKTLTIVCAGKASTPQQYLKTLIGSAASGDDPATGLYAFIDGTGVTIKTSTSW